MVETTTNAQNGILELESSVQELEKRKISLEHLTALTKSGIKTDKIPNEVLSKLEGLDTDTLSKVGKAIEKDPYVIDALGKLDRSAIQPFAVASEKEDSLVKWEYLARNTCAKRGGYSMIEKPGLCQGPRYCDSSCISCWVGYMIRQFKDVTPRKLGFSQI
jgi:hypothetical protein